MTIYKSMLKKLLLIPVLVMFLFVGIAQAQTDELPDAGLLPGNPFYFLKSTSEGVVTFFTFNKESKAERYAFLASKRLAEAEALASEGDSERAEKATEKYRERIEKALEKAEEAKIGGKDVDEILEKVAEATLKHQEVLARVYEQVPEQARESIMKAMERSAQGYDKALKAVSEEKREEIENRIEEMKHEAEDRLEELRAKGIPVPELKDRKERKEEMEMEMKGEHEDNEMDDKDDEDYRNDGVACTQEVRQCPDGSYVGRVAPKCEFKLCPSEKTEKEMIREEEKQRAEETQRNLEKELENSNLTEQEREALKQAGEKAREDAKQEAEEKYDRESY